MFCFFADIQTQWRTGMAGVIGLDYNVLPLMFRLHKVPRKDQPEYFECLRAMEIEALGVIHSKE